MPGDKVPRALLAALMQPDSSLDEDEYVHTPMEQNSVIHISRFHDCYNNEQYVFMAGIVILFISLSSQVAQ